jgi:dihydropyrimidinase
LWKGLRTGDVSVISTDTCTFTREQKAMWEGDWTKIPMGMPGLETLMPLTYTHGVLANRLTLEEMSAKLSTNPAKIMGLYPRKGALAVGSDADITLLDTRTRRVIRAADLHETDYTPWEGHEVAAWPSVTITRGKLAVENGQLLANLSDGQFLPRKIGDDIRSRPAV